MEQHSETLQQWTLSQIIGSLVEKLLVSYYAGVKLTFIISQPISMIVDKSLTSIQDVHLWLH